jgi:Dna[CI] antecedent DciA-like protein
MASTFSCITVQPICAHIIWHKRCSNFCFAAALIRYNIGMSIVLKQLLDAFATDKKDWRWVLLNNWPTIMGPLHEQVRLEKIEEHALTIGVYQSSWLQELYLLSPMLIKTINEHLQTDQIHHIRFRAAVKKKHVARATTANHHATKPSRPLNEREQTALAKIEDPQLRSVLTSFLWRCAK